MFLFADTDVDYRTNFAFRTINSVVVNPVFFFGGGGRFFAPKAVSTPSNGREGALEGSRLTSSTAGTRARR